MWISSVSGAAVLVSIILNGARGQEKTTKWDKKANTTKMAQAAPNLYRFLI